MTIKKVSEKYHITQDTLRYYERVGMRDYGERDCSWTTRSGVMRMRWKGRAYDHTK